MGNNKFVLYFILCILVFFVVIRNSGGLENPNINPEPNNPVVVPEPPVIVPPKPEPVKPKVLTNNFVYDDYDKAISLAKEFDKNLIIVFGADWCPYCVVLKNDAKNISEFKNYIVCFIDTDKKEENQSIINKFRPRSLPMSVMINDDEQLISKHTGYRNSSYKSWLNSNR